MNCLSSLHIVIPPELRIYVNIARQTPGGEETMRKTKTELKDICKSFRRDFSATKIGNKLLKDCAAWRE